MHNEPQTSSEENANNHTLPFLMILVAFGILSSVLCCISRWRRPFFSVQNTMPPLDRGTHLLGRDPEKPAIFDLWTVTCKDKVFASDDIMPLSVLYWKDENAPSSAPLPTPSPFGSEGEYSSHMVQIVARIAMPTPGLNDVKNNLGDRGEYVLGISNSRIQR
ncbi:hypothetical protein E1B28_000398 [Marasmius oreades]|uniref:Uncharacterized protein n=1 Tax=Marasmius oreades TaxID=181124 RepID=A0A9P7V1B3_9AGAR|nr:uncharacterized protein E1B28_000398 [Marasmius oreades]KAG7098448.1 hypothetical protein E1B28_000398 [Marasmius oreades]